MIGVSNVSLVDKDVLPYQIVAGVPAKHIRWRFNENQIKTHEEKLNLSLRELGLGEKDLCANRKYLK